MQDNEKKPALRFKGFTDPWEQRKLGELVEIGDIDHRMPETVDVGIPYLMTGDFCGTNELNFNGVKLISEIEYNQLSQKIKPEQGDILFARYASVGTVRYVDFTRKFLISYSCAIIKKGKKINSQYLYHFITSDEAQKQIKLQINTGSQSNIGIDSMKNNILVQMPLIDEQVQIANMLTNLDHLITLHQRKYDKLTNVKKSMLEKMFPQNGSNVPEIRFKGFTEAWEQRKVGDLLIERNQQAPMSDEYPLMAFIANEGVAPKGDRYDRSALVTDTANKLYKKTEIGDFIYSSNNLETGSIGLNKYGKACISPVYSIFEPTGIADSDFLGRRLVRKDFINAMVKWRQGVIYGQWRIHESDFLKIEIPVPSVVEQRKIGAYLDQLDRLITLHQRELEKLKNLKKACLEKMFV